MAPLTGCTGTTAASAPGADGTSPAPSSSTPSGGLPSPVTTPGSATGSASATRSASPSPSMSGRSDRCHTSQLTVTVGPGQGAAGTIYGSLALRNHSDATCTLYGYPGLQLLDAARQALASQVDRGGSAGSALSGPPTLVTLAPGQVAHVQFKYSDVPTGPDAGATQCPRSTYLEVTPPDETDFLLLGTDIGPCRGVITVSPVRAGEPTA